MELIEPVEKLNERLARDFGYFDGTMPQWRIVWSDDEFEKRLTDFTAEGFRLLTPIVVELPKYRQWVLHKFILERALPIPEFVETDLVTKFSYEPVWTFEDNQGNPLPPRWEAILLIIRSIYVAAAQSIGARYKDPELDKDEANELKLQRLIRLEEELFGNETEVGDALTHRQAIVVPTSYGDLK